MGLGEQIRRLRIRRPLQSHVTVLLVPGGDPPDPVVLVIMLSRVIEDRFGGDD